MVLRDLLQMNLRNLSPEEIARFRQALNRRLPEVVREAANEAKIPTVEPAVKTNTGGLSENVRKK